MTIIEKALDKMDEQLTIEAEIEALEQELQNVEDEVKTELDKLEIVEAVVAAITPVIEDPENIKEPEINEESIDDKFLDVFVALNAINEKMVQLHLDHEAMQNTLLILLSKSEVAAVIEEPKAIEEIAPVEAFIQPDIEPEEKPSKKSRFIGRGR